MISGWFQISWYSSKQSVPLHYSNGKLLPSAEWPPLKFWALCTKFCWALSFFMPTASFTAMCIRRGSSNSLTTLWNLTRLDCRITLRNCWNEMTSAVTSTTPHQNSFWRKAIFRVRWTYGRLAALFILWSANGILSKARTQTKSKRRYSTSTSTKFLRWLQTKMSGRPLLNWCRFCKLVLTSSSTCVQLACN